MEHPFDENGSLKDWWKPEDYEAFTARTQKVIDQFEGQDSYGAKINGKLTVSENVADLGGIAAALEAAKKEEDFSAEEFFTNFARIWRMKARTDTCNSSQVSMSTHQENSVPMFNYQTSTNSTRNLTLKKATACGVPQKIV